MDMKKPNVAADDSMYCDNVAIVPLGPGPALSHQRFCRVREKMELTA